MLIVISMLSAILAGMGVGGGAIFVLMSTSFLDVNQKEAQALNLILFIVVGVSATVYNFKNKNIDLKIIKKILPVLLIGSCIGTSLFKEISNQSLRTYFLCFLVVIGIYEIITSVKNIKKAKNNSNKIRKE